MASNINYVNIINIFLILRKNKKYMHNFKIYFLFCFELIDKSSYFNNISLATSLKINNISIICDTLCERLELVFYQETKYLDLQKKTHQL